MYTVSARNIEKDDIWGTKLNILYTQTRKTNKNKMDK